MSRQYLRLLVGASALLMAAAGSAHAADAIATPAPTMTGAGAEGTDVSEVVVTAEATKAAADAPSKASLTETQPESIISRSFIELATPEVGDWTTTALIAPSVTGITSNGGDIGEYNKLTMRAFSDGQYNLTFDGIAFGDTNDPTHHSASYFPASTIQAVVIDRGPGAAGDLGQANFGGAIHFFSLDPTATFGLSQKVTYGSFNTIAEVTTINTGAVSYLNGGKLVINLDNRTSSGELSHSGGYASNQIAKFVMPVTDNITLTVFGQHEYTKFALADAGPGATWQQVQLYGKNFALTNIANDEHNYKYNYEGKGSDFYYVDLKGQVVPELTAENQLYTYYYSNKTTAANDITGLVGGPNTSVLQNTSAAFGRTATTNPSDIGGYDKLNLYRVWGDIVRVNKSWSFGTLKIGGLIETSSTDRHNGFIDLSNGGAYDYKFAPASKFPQLPGITNYKLQENSKWLQYQGFADFEWKPLDNLTITPGFKYVSFKRSVSAANESVAGAATKNQPLVGSNTFTQPLYFGTINYKIRPDWSVYGQVATSFLIPSLSALYDSGVSLQNLQPQRATTYQTGTVFTHGNVTADADVYRVDVSNLVQSCTIPNPVVGNPNATVSGSCNLGNAVYQGVEGEAAYALGFGLTLFANGSINRAEQLANNGNAALGIAASPNQALKNAPKWTDAVGGIYHNGPISGSVTYKQSGAYVAGYTSGKAINLSGYDTVDLAAAYDFGHYKVKLQVLNLADKRAITGFSGNQLYSTSDTGLYSFQAGREIQATLQAKF